MIKLLKFLFFLILISNTIYFTRIYNLKEKKLKDNARKHKTIEIINDDIDYPDLNYNELNNTEKISYLLDSVENDKQRFWQGQIEITEPNLSINPKDFINPKLYKDKKLVLTDQEWAQNWNNKSTIFYDPRLTLSVYLDEIKHQFLKRNPGNDKNLDYKISVPFAWEDWVDLTMLNEELSKPINERLNCQWLQSKVSKPTKYPDFCKNLIDLSDDELLQLGKSRDQLPGFIVNSSPMNKAPQKQAMLQGKAHLLTHQHPPLSIIFLTRNGTYEVQVNEHKRFIETNIFKNFLKRNKINIDVDLIVNPITKFNELLTKITPRPLNLDDDIYKMHAITSSTVKNSSRDLYLDPESFNYQSEQVDEQIEHYENRLNNINKAMTNELHYNKDIIEFNKLNRHELNHYQSLKHAASLSVKEETTYYKLATLLKSEDNKDTGWHYEWRFFNGAMRYLKEGWTVQQLEIREQIILDRLLRNWFKFTQEKGIISWIAHGPLLSWYWDGLMFPYDIDIDIQMPSSELNRLLKNYNMTLVVEDVNDGYGKYLIDCSTFLHHRDKAFKDNHIDARFIDIDSGTYIDITGIGKNNEPPPAEFDSYIRLKNSVEEPIELYMDRRKHWLTFDKISPLRYSMIGGVPVYVPNDIMSMLNHEYAKGTTSYYFNGYYYVPLLRLWLKREKLQILLDERGIKDLNKSQMIDLVINLDIEDKLKILETHDDILTEYYLTHNYTQIHELEKKFMLDHLLQFSINDVDNEKYRELTSSFKIGKPMRKCLFDFEYIERLKYVD